MSLRAARQPLRVAVVGGDQDVVRALVHELREHIVSDTRLSVHLAWRPHDMTEAMEASIDVILLGVAALGSRSASTDETDVSMKAGAVDKVLLYRAVTDTDGHAGRASAEPTVTQPPAGALAAEDRWRDRLIRLGLDWSVVGGAGGDAVRQAMDALAPLLRGRASAGSGLFTRLSERNAQPAARFWRCADCDEPDCEHALRAVRPSPDSHARG